MNLRRTIYVAGFVLLIAAFHALAYTSAQLASSYHQSGERGEQTTLTASTGLFAGK